MFGIHKTPLCLTYKWHMTSPQQFHRFKAAPLGVSLPFLLVGPFTPDMRAQNDLRRFAFFEPGLSLLGLVVTGA